MLAVADLGWSRCDGNLRDRLGPSRGASGLWVWPRSRRFRFTRDETTRQRADHVRKDFARKIRRRDAHALQQFARGAPLLPRDCDDHVQRTRFVTSRPLRYIVRAIE